MQTNAKVAAAVAELFATLPTKAQTLFICHCTECRKTSLRPRLASRSLSGENIQGSNKVSRRSGHGRRPPDTHLNALSAVMRIAGVASKARVTRNAERQGGSLDERLDLSMRFISGHRANCQASLFQTRRFCYPKEARWPVLNMNPTSHFQQSGADHVRHPLRNMRFSAA